MLTLVCCNKEQLHLILHTKNSNILKEEILIKFGEKVRELRKAKNLSQEQLAARADLHRTYIGMIERAEKNITLVNIEKLARALKVSVKELFDNEKFDSNIAE